MVKHRLIFQLQPFGGLVGHVDIAGVLFVGAVVLDPLAEENRTALAVGQADTAGETVKLAFVILVVAESAARRVHQGR